MANSGITFTTRNSIDMAYQRTVVDAMNSTGVAINLCGIRYTLDGNPRQDVFVPNNVNFLRVDIEGTVGRAIPGDDSQRGGMIVIGPPPNFWDNVAFRGKSITTVSIKRTRFRQREPPYEKLFLVFNGDKLNFVGNSVLLVELHDLDNVPKAQLAMELQIVFEQQKPEQDIAIDTFVVQTFLSETGQRFTLDTERVPRMNDQSISDLATENEKSRWFSGVKLVPSQRFEGQAAFTAPEADRMFRENIAPRSDRGVVRRRRDEDDDEDDEKADSPEDERVQMEQERALEQTKTPMIRELNLSQWKSRYGRDPLEVGENTGIQVLLVTRDDTRVRLPGGNGGVLQLCKGCGQTPGTGIGYERYRSQTRDGFDSSLMLPRDLYEQTGTQWSQDMKNVIAASTPELDVMRGALMSLGSRYIKRRVMSVVTLDKLEKSKPKDAAVKAIVRGGGSGYFEKLVRTMAVCTKCGELRSLSKLAEAYNDARKKWQYAVHCQECLQLCTMSSKKHKTKFGVPIGTRKGVDVESYFTHFTKTHCITQIRSRKKVYTYEFCDSRFTGPRTPQTPQITTLMYLFQLTGEKFQLCPVDGTRVLLTSEKKKASRFPLDHDRENIQRTPEQMQMRGRGTRGEEFHEHGQTIPILDVLGIARELRSKNPSEYNYTLKDPNKERNAFAHSGGCVSEVLQRSGNDGPCQCQWALEKDKLSEADLRKNVTKRRRVATFREMRQMGVQPERDEDAIANVIESILPESGPAAAQEPMSAPPPVQVQQQDPNAPPPIPVLPPLSVQSGDIGPEQVAFERPPSPVAGVEEDSGDFPDFAPLPENFGDIDAQRVSVEELDRLASMDTSGRMKHGGIDTRTRRMRPDVDSDDDDYE